MCYIFRQICPFHSELRKGKISTCLPLPTAFVLSPPTFWEARDQPEPGSLFPRMKDPGNEVAKELCVFLESWERNAANHSNLPPEFPGVIVS